VPPVQRPADGLDKQQAVAREALQLAVYSRGINAHLTLDRDGRAEARRLLIADQSLAVHRRVLACSQLHEMMHIARELCAARFASLRSGRVRIAGNQAWLDKYYTVNDDWSPTTGVSYWPSPATCSIRTMRAIA